MHAATRLSPAALALCLLVACGGGSSTADEDSAQAAEAAAEELGRDTDETIVDDLIQTQDKARAVEGVTLGHKRELDEAIEASSGDSAAAEEE